jgi:hypothetical protein
MNNLDILQKLLDDLKDRKMRYILIPCPLSVHAEILMRTLASKNITWYDDGRILQPNSTRWSRYKEETLYAISCNRSGSFEVQAGDIGAIDRVNESGHKYAIMHIYGIIGVVSAFEALRYD